MLKNVSEKYKFYLLVIGFLLILIISYQLAIKSAFEVRNNYRSIQSSLAEVENLPGQINELSLQLDRINAKYFEQKSIFEDNHEIILERLSKIAAGNHVSVSDYPARHVILSNSLEIETHRMVLEGRFNSLLKTIREVEVEEKLGNLASVSFYSEYNRRTKQTTLYAEIIIQNFRNLKQNETTQ